MAVGIVSGVVGGTVLGAGAAIGGAAAARPPSPAPKKRNEDFDDCVTAGLHSQQKIQFLENDTVTISDLPQICMLEVQNYNAHPQIGEMNALYGSTRVTGPNSVILVDMPEYVIKAIQGAQESQAAQVAQAAPQGQALPPPHRAMRV